MSNLCENAFFFCLTGVSLATIWGGRRVSWGGGAAEWAFQFLKSRLYFLRVSLGPGSGVLGPRLGAELGDGVDMHRIWGFPELAEPEERWRCLRRTELLRFPSAFSACSPLWSPFSMLGRSLARTLLLYLRNMTFLHQRTMMMTTNRASRKDRKEKALI